MGFLDKASKYVTIYTAIQVKKMREEQADARRAEERKRPITWMDISPRKETREEIRRKKREKKRTQLFWIGIAISLIVPIIVICVCCANVTTEAESDAAVETFGNCIKYGLCGIGLTVLLNIMAAMDLFVDKKKEREEVFNERNETVPKTRKRRTSKET